MPNLNYIIVNEMTKSLNKNIFKLTLGRCRYRYIDISWFSNDSLDQFSWDNYKDDLVSYALIHFISSKK